ncbi:hypothetical protein Ancab_005421 [Ancistrocladus abbreviatus]
MVVTLGPTGASIVPIGPLEGSWTINGRKLGSDAVGSKLPPSPSSAHGTQCEKAHMRIRAHLFLFPFPSLSPCPRVQN